MREGGKEGGIKKEKINQYKEKRRDRKHGLDYDVRGGKEGGIKKEKVNTKKGGTAHRGKSEGEKREIN